MKLVRGVELVLLTLTLSACRRSSAICSLNRSSEGFLGATSLRDAKSHGAVLR